MLDAVVRFNPSFAWTALSGFQSTGIPFFAQAALSGFRLAGCTVFLFIPNFCPNLSHHFFFGSPGCPFLPGLFYSFRPAGLLYEVLFNCVRIHRGWKILAIHGRQQQGSARENLLDHEWAFMTGCPFSPTIVLRRKDPFQHHIAYAIYPRSHLSVKSTLHSLLVQLPMTDGRQPLFLNQAQNFIPGPYPIRLLQLNVHQDSQ
jgi:hypothetical protein